MPRARSITRSLSPSTHHARICRLAAAIVLPLCVVCSPVAAQSRITEEIIVTASLRDATLNQTPVSVSILQPNQLGTTVQHLEELLGRIPNVNFASGASRARFVQLRGIGERGQFAETLNPSVGLLLDGVDLSGIGTAATLFDIEQVEVLRGPQGTLYGANALAGLVNLTTPSPSDTLTSRWRLDAGDHGAQGISGVVSAPLTDALGVRVSASRYRDDGFMDNRFLGKDDTDNHDEAAYRAKLRWQDEARSLTVSAGHIDIDNGYDAFSLDNTRTTLSDEPGFDRQTTDYLAVAFASDAGIHARLEATLTFASSDIDYGYDEDWTFAGFDPIGYTSTDRYERDRDTQTADVRWLSVPGAELGGWDWTVGVFGLRQDVELERTYTFAGPFNNDFEVAREALYGEISRDLTTHWRLTVGARIERHSADYEDTNGVAFDPDDTLFGGRVVLERALDSGMAYASVSRGYKTGGFNQDGSLNAARREFDEESLLNFEIGYKGTLADGRLQLRAALFRMQRDDIQLSKSETRPIAGTPGAVEFIEFIDNASNGFNQGLEVELDFAATERLNLFANLGWLDTEYDDDDTGRNIGGRDQAHAPGYQFFAGARYDFGAGWSVQAEVEGKDEFYYSVTHDTRSDAYELWHMSVRYDADAWGLSVWGRNLGDEDYTVRGFLFGNDPRDFYTARPFTQLGEPRQYGVTLEATF